MKLLVLEPYLGGSHARFLDELLRHLPVEHEVLGLPARAWKWRLRLAALHFADLLATRDDLDQFDVIFCSSMLDLQSFRGLAPPTIRRLPAVCYWHENQLAYPVRQEDERGVTPVVGSLGPPGISG